MMRRTILLLLVVPALFSLKSVAQEEHYNHGELNWKSIETAHFFVHYHQGAERTANVIAKVAEDIYGPVTTLYQHEPDHKVNFVIKDYDDYSNGAAYFFDNKIEIWAPSLDFIFRGSHNWLRNVITHEFTHIIQIQTSMKFGRRFPGFYLQWLNYEEERRQDVLYGYPNTVVSYPISGFIIPSWFAEGVAQYNRPELSYDKWDSHRDMILRSYVLDSAMLSWSEMSVFGKTSLGNESSYNAGFALTKFISERYGQDAIPKIAKNISRVNNVTIDQAIELTLGMSGKDLYQEWKDSITARYLSRTQSIRANLVEGRNFLLEDDSIIVEGPGFANLYTAFSPEGKRIAYATNGESDYLGTSGLEVGNFETKKSKSLVPGVRSQISWSPDGNKLYYTKHSHENPNGSEISDIYSYDLKEEEETRITYGRRAISACVSPDGASLVFTFEGDGTVNLGRVDSAGNNFKQLTAFHNGEQSYNPHWSPEGSLIVFGYSVKDGQDIAWVPSDSGMVLFIESGDDDTRDPIFSADGMGIIFASDRTGIFNLYQKDLKSGTVVQLTNVLGGAFMPSVSSYGAIAYSLYTSKGYKLKMIDVPSPADYSSSSYVYQRPVAKTEIDPSLARNQFDFAALRNYNDNDVPQAEAKPYKNVFTTTSIIPFLRIDNYNTKSSGLDFLKPGFYFVSSDMLEKYNMFGGAAINHIFERDLFLTFEYRDRVFGFHQLGLHPTFALELYNVSRKSTTRFGLGNDTISTGTTLSLFEVDFLIKGHVFSPIDVLTLAYSHSIYSSGFDFFIVPGDETHAPTPASASKEDYFIGNNLSLQWRIEMIAPSRTREINPVGRTFAFRLDQEFNKFTRENADGYSEAEVTETGVHLKLFPYTFSRLEARYTEHLKLPFWKHTLSVTLRGGTIFGPDQPDFFNFYAGGLVGMKGYPFYSIEGNDLATVNVAYRFPIWENIDFRIFQLYFDRLYGEFHADMGNAWNGTPDIRNFKRDVGFELRLDAFSWYAYPTRIFFNGTYGLDSFSYSKRNITANYGKEWRFYFGVLFGFDFSNDIKRLVRDFNGQ
ncbi:MAG: biopolymer transporter Tol [Bacteroidota bacterium]